MTQQPQQCCRRTNLSTASLTRY
uniref:Uncharacterized protein n=1 Tax=Anguilla anguilla TaxID=7936 RepID=A0A0E9U0P6_ANGAN